MAGKITRKRIEKISFTTKVEKLNYPDGEFWQSKMPKK